MFVKMIRRCAILMLLAVWVVGPALQAQTPARKLPTIPFEKYKLKNGLEVILSEDHTVPLVSVNIWYHVGPANEKAGRTGFAHLFEHMMFEGSQHVGGKAHFSYLEGAGATDINGTTNFDRTNYYETVPSNQLELALWLESDRMGYLLGTLDIEKLANQRDVVRNERRQSVENAPYGLAEERLGHLAFPKSHPYYAQVIGSHADVEAAKLEDVREFFQQYYTPNNATMAITGDFDKAAIKGLVEKYFGTIPAGPAVPKIEVTTPPITSERRAVVTDQVELPRVYMGWITPPVFSAGDAECNLYSQILGGGKSSRLYKSLVYEKQIAQDVSTSMEETKLGSMFELIATAKPNVKPEDLEKAIDEVINKLAAEGPTAAEVERARNLTETALVRGLQRSNGVANRLNYYNQFLGTPDYFVKDIARFDAAKPADVQRVAQTVFKKDARAVVYAVPGKKVIEDVAKTSEEENKKQAAEAGASKVTMADEAWRATAPRPGPPSKFTLPAPEVAKLPNGLTILLVERHNLPIVSATLYTMSGSELNPVDKPGLSSFVAQMLTEGTASRSPLKFAEDADQIGAIVQAGAGYSSGTVSLSALSWNAGPAMDLAADATLHPAFAEKEVERVRNQRVTAVLQENDEPFALAQRTATQLLYPGSPYGFSLIGTEASNKAMAVDELKQFWKKTYVPANSAVAISGDLNMAEAKELAAKYFGGWTGVPAGAVPLETPKPPTRSIAIVDKPGAPQTFLLLASLGAKRSTPDYVPIEVMNTALGGLFSSRINMNLREEHGYTYGAQSFFNYRRGVGPFLAGGAIRTDATAPATHELFKELTRIREAELTPDELQKAKDSFSKSLVGLFETTGDIASTVGLQFVFGLPMDYYRNLPAQIDKVTAGDALRVAKEYVHPDATVVVAVGDRAKIEPELKKLDLGAVNVVQ
ncbi:MAG TPA: pitrilysin family protein [Candidatus Acidoferrum sp.]|nr:pitrilysin family protein [Candidatus Acidoferrum sp.]